jgi:hypothetical protein
MNKSSTLWCLGLALASIAVTGCVGAPDENVASAQEAAFTSNAFTSNAFTSNAFTSNAFTSNAFTSNALTSGALTSNSLTSAALSDPLSREFLQYTVSCALSPQQSVSFTVDGQSYTYPGSLGLAPQWGHEHGSCDETCQEWVSGCLMARVDFLGEMREISVRGSSPALKTTHEEREDYSAYEATYYGNVFKSPQARYACLMPGQHSDPRVCGPSLQNCVVTFTGDCFTHCNLPLADGAFPDCRDKPWWDPSATAYVGSVTVFLPGSGSDSDP